MKKNTCSQIQVLMILIFLVLAPLKYAVLLIAGTNTVGQVVMLNTSCNYGKPEKPQPRLMVVFRINKIKHQLLGQGGYGIPEFCSINIGDFIKVTYYKIPNINYLIATINNPKEMFLVIFGGGFFLNIIGNIMLIVVRWNELKNLKFNK